MRTQGKWKAAKANPNHHTPLYIYAEWFDDKKRRNSFIIADRFSEHPEHSHTANAEFICLACNSHDDLLEACKELLEFASGRTFNVQMLRKAEAAIAKAEKGSK